PPAPGPRGRAAGEGQPRAAPVDTQLAPVRPLYPDSVRAGFVHPLSVEWARHRDLAVNPRSGKLVRVLDERPTA
ncbi:phenylacetate--CoA ligase family protein, partial [Streptomyces sp. NPDC059552]